MCPILSQMLMEAEVVEQNLKHSFVSLNVIMGFYISLFVYAVCNFVWDHHPMHNEYPFPVQWQVGGFHVLFSVWPQCNNAVLFDIYVLHTSKNSCGSWYPFISWGLLPLLYRQRPRWSYVSTMFESSYWIFFPAMHINNLFCVQTGYWKSLLLYFHQRHLLWGQLTSRTMSMHMLDFVGATSGR